MPSKTEIIEHFGGTADATKPMQLKLTYPQAPGFRKGSIDTSREAAEAIKPREMRMRERVEKLYQYYGGAGMTADHAADLLNLSILTVRPRVSELVRLGRLKDTGIRRKNASGKNAAVFCHSGK